MKIRYIIIGAGNRGNVYATYALENPNVAEVVGIAEPQGFRTEAILRRFQEAKITIPAENIVSDWRDILAKEKFADAVVVTTPDALHVEPVIAFANKGYHILVEKPMAVQEEDCIKMVKAIKDNNVFFAVGHVMRYTPYTQKIKEVIRNGTIGDVVNIQHVEPVGFFHFAHSYVRGNWHKESDSTFSLMAKCCHDIDWIRYVLGRRCTSVSSFGSLNHFRKEKKPKAAGDAKRCLDCSIKEECPYSAIGIYLEPAQRGLKGWPVNIIVRSPVVDVESVTEAITNGPYGRCVYEGENDVCDNQVVNMEFEDGQTASMTMIAFSKEICVRKTRIYGTHGEMECDGTNIRLVTFSNGQTSTDVLTPQAMVPGTAMIGHSGADWYLMHGFIEAIRTGDASHILSGPLETLESHLIVFAAEKSRKERTVIDTSGIAEKVLQSQ